MKLLRINEDLVIAPELISHYSVQSSWAASGYQVLAHPIMGGDAIVLSTIAGSPPADPAQMWRDFRIDEREAAWAELARIQALVEEL